MYLYIIEGIDGSGKSTQIEILKKIIRRLKHEQCFVFLNEPTNFDTGKIIRKYLKENRNLTLEEWLLLFDKDREKNVQFNILPNKDKIIVMDRYYLSTASYQAKDPDDVFKIFINSFNKYPKPKRIFYLDIDLKNALERIKKRHPYTETFEKEQDLSRILQNYQYLETIANEYSLKWENLSALNHPLKIAKQILKKIFSDYKDQNKTLE